MVKTLYEIFNFEIKKYISYLWPYENESMNVFRCYHKKNYNFIFYMPQYLKCFFFFVLHAIM